MKSKNILTFTSAIVLSIAISFVCAEDKVDLRLKLEKGQSYKMQTVQDFKLSQVENGQQRDTSLIINIRYIYDVEDVDADGNAWIKVTYNSLYSKEEDSTGSKIEYDSSNRPDVIPRGLLAFDALLGKSFLILVSPKGEIKDIKGADLLQKAIIDKIPPKNEGEISFNTNDMIKEWSGEQALREALEENLFAFYQNEPVGVGDTWQKSYVISKNIPPINVQAIYTFKERKDGITTVDLFAMAQPNLGTEPIPTGEGTIQFKFSGDITGIIELNESTGWIVHSQQTSRLKGQVMLIYPQIPQGMIVPVSITDTITQESF